MIKLIHKFDDIANCRLEEFFLQTPTKRMIRYEIDDYKILSDEPGNYFLSFPHMLFKFVWENFQSKSTNELLSCSLVFTNPTVSKFYYPVLYNVDSFLEVCLGDCSDFNSSLSAIDSFWKTTFNQGCTGSRTKYEYEDPFQTFKIWENYTKENPNWFPQPDQLIETPIKLNHYYQNPFEIIKTIHPKLT